MSKPTLLAILGTILLAAAILLNSLIDWDRTSRDTTASPRPETPPTSAPPAPAAKLPTSVPPSSPSASSESAAAGQAAEPTASAPDGRAPSFDVVRINPNGDAVLAGRAAPGAEITVRDGDKVIGRGQADERGEWVLVPDKPLPPGGRVFSLSAQSRGGESVAAESELVLVVPERDGRQGALALRLPNVPETAATAAPPAGATPPRPSVLQSPFSSDPSRGVAVGVIEYDETGRAAISGSAQPGTRLQITLDDQTVGEVQADRRGEWHLALPAPITPGEHRLRVERKTPDGKLADRAEYDFARKPVAEGAAPAGAIVVVESGNSLWRIARRTYGEGMRYTLIVEANRQQIKNPDLIYPGQIFDLPRNR